MKYSVGDQIRVRINKIQEKGCYCTFLPYGPNNPFGFMPNNLMPRFLDKNGVCTLCVGDQVSVVINKITDSIIYVCDPALYHQQLQIEQFAAKYETWTIFEVEVTEVLDSKVMINVGGIPGIIRKEDVGWNEIDKLDDLLFEGETIHAVYIDHKYGQLYFSLKLLNEKPYAEDLYDLSLTDLLKYAGHESNIFIGQAKQYHYGLFIENLYATNESQKGKLLTDPVFGHNLRAIVPSANFNVEVDKFYRVELKLAPKDKRLARNQLFQFAAINIEETGNPYKRDVDLTFEKFTSPAGNVATAHLLDEVGKNMYSAKDRMFFELIQNADDAASANGVLVHVQTSGDYLIVCHNGYSFDKDDFEAITSAANGTKKANENKTGYKGIGFKSVFTDSEEVLIKTGGYQFKFDKNDERFSDFESFYFLVNKLRTEDERDRFLHKFHSERTRFKGVVDIPWQLEPIWIDTFPGEFGERFTSSNVAIALKLGEHKIAGENGYHQAIDDIISNPRFMLFLRNTRRIDFNGKSIGKTIAEGKIILKNSFHTNRVEYFKREDFEISVNNAAFEHAGIDLRIRIDEQDEITGKVIEAKFVDLHNQVFENIPQKIAINTSTEISFAVPIEENGAVIPNTKCNDISMFAFLPTLVKDFRFPVYINANFILDPPRQRILGDNPWNFYLMHEIAHCLVQWCASLNEGQNKYALNVLIPQYFEEDGADTQLLARHFNAAYQSALQSTAFILDHTGKLARQDEVLLDRTGLSAIVGADLFCQLLGTGKRLPSSEIDNQILENPIFEEIQMLEFDDLIPAITHNRDFNEWFITAENDQQQKLYRWINQCNTTPKRNGALRQFISNLPLFSFGKEYKTQAELESSKHIITTAHIVPIKEILSKLGFVCSDNRYDDDYPLSDFLDSQDEAELFNAIKACDFSVLDAIERKNLFIGLVDFDGIGEARLKTLTLFRNLKGEPAVLGEMVAYRENSPAWLYPYVICAEDDCPELEDFVIRPEDEFECVIQKHCNDIDASFAELYKTYCNEWTGQFTRHVIDTYNLDADILFIIEESDLKTKEYFLNHITKLNLQSTTSYPKESLVSRILQLALSVYNEPSDFSSKIYFDGQCINSFSVSDAVNCGFYANGEAKKVKMSLAKILPQYETQSDSINKLKELFENRKDLDKFFIARPKPIEEVHRELNQYLKIPETNFSVWNVEGNAFQYLFATYYRRQEKGWFNAYVPKIELRDQTDEFIADLLDFLYDNNLSIADSPFTYHLKTYFIDRYLGSDHLFEDEQILPTIAQWIDHDKKAAYLFRNGVRDSNHAVVRFRQLFLENRPIDFLDKLSNDDLNAGLRFIATANGYNRPFGGDNQKAILRSLKSRCNGLTTDWDHEKIKANAKEWNTTQYNAWTEHHLLRIYLYPGPLPRQLFYRNVVICNDDSDQYDYYYNPQERQLWVSNTREIEDILLEVAQKRNANFDFDDYRELCLKGKVFVSREEITAREKKIESLSEDNRKKDEIIAQYRTRFGELTAPTAIEQTSDMNINAICTKAQEEMNLQFGRAIVRDGLSQEKQIAAHKEAEQIIRDTLEKSGYDCSLWIAKDSDTAYPRWQSFNQVENIISPEGRKINMVAKSARGGYIYLSATDFEFLTSDRHNMLMVWDGNLVHSVSAEEIFTKDSNVNLIFDTEYTPIHYYAALSKIFQYVKRTTFAVKNPHYNPYDRIKSFGMDSKVEGIQALGDDNNDL